MASPADVAERCSCVLHGGDCPVREETARVAAGETFHRFYFMVKHPHITNAYHI